MELIKLKELCKRDSHDAWYEWRSLCCEGIQEGIGCEEISVKFLELEENFQLLKSDCEQIGEMRKRNEKLREGLKTDVKMHLPMRYPVNEDTDEMSNLRQCGSNSKEKCFLLCRIYSTIDKSSKLEIDHIYGL